MQTSVIMSIMFLVSFVLLGCGPANSVYNVNKSPIEIYNTAEKKISATTVEKAIVQASARLGWVVRKIKDGEIEASIRLRTHSAVVTVLYDTKEYSILYKNSDNLNYNPSNNTIHKNYNGWIQNLDNGIRAELTGISVHKPVYYGPGVIQIN